MKVSTTKIRLKSIFSLLSIFIFFLIWQVFSHRLSDLVLPSIFDVIHKIGEILGSSQGWQMISITLYRLGLGYSIGFSLALLAAIIMGKSIFFDGILSPMMAMIQTVPPISWLVLALIWFGFSGRPAIFIVALSSLPIIAISVKEGIRNIDNKLLDLAKVYRLGQVKTFINISLPSIAPFLKSGVLTSLGNTWKIGVMAEVLTTTDGIGGMIKEARINIETDTVLAWSFLIVGLYFLSSLGIKLVFKLGGRFIDRT